jgi:hypothetical protein
MKSRINEIKPDLILGFGRTASNALNVINLMMPIRYENAPHPSSRSQIMVNERYKKLLKIIENQSVLEADHRGT